MQAEAVVEAWSAHVRRQGILLDAVTPEGLAGVPAGMKGRSVGEIFAHMHNVRLTWLELTPGLLDELAKVPVKTKEDKAALSRDGLRAAMDSSAAAVAALLRQSFAAGKVRGYKGSPMTFFTYLVAHEWYHHGEICMTLTQAGHKLDDAVLYGIWEWDAH